MSLRFRPQLLLTFAATIALSLPTLAQQANVRLPSLGSEADTLISPQEASQYGAEFLGELRGAHLVLDDPQVDQYLHTLGYRLAAASADPTQHYTFTLLNVPEINSFATFGGYIFIFSGMFTITQNQSELAAVMAHELAHISQHHLQRAMADQKKSTPLYLLGALAAGLAASAVDEGSHGTATMDPSCQYGCGGSPYYGGGRADATAGAVMSVLALLQQHQIEFTRADESEADHVGIDTLAKAGFDPEAMADIFAHMQALIRPGGDGGIAAGNTPGFLQDHPVTSVRIADARARARVLEKQLNLRTANVNGEKQYQISVSGGDSPAPGLLPLPFVKPGTTLTRNAAGPSELQYELMRERVRVLSAVNPRTVLGYYQRNMGNSAKFADAVSNRYGYALALIQLGKAKQAAPVMQKLADARPDNLTLQLGLADAERRDGQRSAALKRYAALNATWPNDPAVVLAYSQTLLDSGAKADAKVAQGLLKPLLNDDSEPSLYATYGHACHVAGDEVHAGIAYADATYLYGNPAAALDQLHRMLKRKDLDYYTRAQIDARIAQITPIVLEMRRRHLRDQDDGNSLNSLNAKRQQSGFSLCGGSTCSQL